MEEDGFQLVNRRKRHSRLKISDAKPPQRIEGSIEDIEVALDRSDKLLEVGGFSEWVIDGIKQHIGEHGVSQVYVIGNGHFDAPWEAGAHQLALVRRICGALNAEMIFQEPCTSAAEQEWLSYQKGIVVRNSPDVRIELPSEDDSRKTIVVMFHGLHDLLDEFLAFNWNSNLYNVLLLCNDYSKIDFIGGDSQTDSQFQALNTFRKLAKFVILPEYSPHPSFFLNSSLAFLECDTRIPRLI
ncbi:hypothetical protein Q1695_007039 [Nippostrongylus brasiliensis]|nr:hypothetical protein Q1695_007039 [Nippostrongylus brasiliensis]